MRDRFPPGGSQLVRYAGVFTCAEINSSFYRPHRRSTYERWAASVPGEFRFSVKVPREVTHECRLAGAEPLLDAFLEQTAGLGDKRAVLLVQLPPSFAFDPPVAGAFFAAFRERYDGLLVCEPRHASWFTAECDTLLSSLRVARVAADPATVAGAGVPGGWPDFRYFRWHGAPRTYWSSYDDHRLGELAALVTGAGTPAWCIFDNTAHGEAAPNALTFAALLAGK